MLSRFAPDGIIPEEFKLPSFNHVLLQRKDTKMYQVIFLWSLKRKVKGETEWVQIRQGKRLGARTRVWELDRLPSQAVWSHRVTPESHRVTSPPCGSCPLERKCRTSLSNRSANRFESEL